MERKGSQFVWGFFLIALGIIFLIGNMSRYGMDYLWPVFPLAVGIAFWIGFFNDRKNYGLLMPGSILVVVSLLFFYCNFEGWWHMEELWPLFILAPALGFIAMYFAGSKEQGLLIPAGILGGIGLIFLFITYGFGDYWPFFLIFAGVLLIIFKGLPKKDETEDKDSK